MIQILELIFKLQGTPAIAPSPQVIALKVESCSKGATMPQPNAAKISPPFVARLASLNPQARLQVIIFLKISENDGKRRLPQEVRQQAEISLNQIRGTLQQHQGELLADHPNVLGTIPVEISVNGIYALVQCEAVKSIVENQPLQFSPG
ncbi:MAG: hypothetical protein ACRC8A_18190 [Microcoleaceae cyanobacterium]